MSLSINYLYREQDVESLLDWDELFSLVASKQSLPKHVEASLTFVDNDEIQQLNGDYRHIDAPTDVLSFECDGADSDFLPAQTADEPYLLGDIFIAVDIAEKQAPEFGHTLEEEMSLLFTHGLLHLCGYDHQTPEEADEMEALEEEILTSFWDRPFKRSA